jgi:hypothetical protein
MHPTYVVLFAVVVVGMVTPIAVNVPSQVNALGVPLSNRRKTNLFPSTGVPVGALIARPAACAVTAYWSKDAISGVIEAVEAVLDTRGSIRLLVSVAVPLMVVKPPVAFALLPRAVRTPVPVVVEVIAAPDPPPIKIALAVKVPDCVTNPPVVLTLFPTAVITPVPVVVEEIPVPDPPPSSRALEVNVAVCVTRPLVVLTWFPTAVRTPVPVVVVAGATPAPPPITIAFAASAADDAIVLVAEKYGTPPEVPAVIPVPPFPTGSVPVTPVVKDRFVQFDRFPDEGVPRTGVTNVGDVVSATTVPLPLVVYDVPQDDPVEFAIPAAGQVNAAPEAVAII